MRKYTEIKIRFVEDDEIELINKFQIYCKRKKQRKNASQEFKRKSLNTIYKEILLDEAQRILQNLEAKKQHSYMYDMLSEIMDNTIIPRVYGMLQNQYDQLGIKTDLLNKKTNFLINELGNKDLVNALPIIDNVEELVDEKLWMNDLKAKLIDQIQIKRKF